MKTKPNYLKFPLLPTPRLLEQIQKTKNTVLNDVRYVILYTEPFSSSKSWSYLDELSLEYENWVFDNIEDAQHYLTRVQFDWKDRFPNFEFKIFEIDIEVSASLKPLDNL